MNIFLYKIYFTAFFLAAAINTSAKVMLPAIFGNNMVLQQQTEVKIWGTAEKNSSVTVSASWDNKVHRLTTEGTEWSLLLKTPAAGGPYEIEINDGEPLFLRNILIGEVWICAGQSNMAMPVKGRINQPVLHSNDIIADAFQPEIRLFKVKESIAENPQNNCEGQWDLADPQSVKEFSAVGYLYAKILKEKLNVPIGIIQTAYGATMIESWMSTESLQPFPNISMIDELNLTSSEKNQPSVVFNAMINPLIGYRIKGVLWYQGEQNAANPKGYEKLMPAMVKDWRERWNIGEWPFYYVQIAPFRYSRAARLVPYLREAQQNAMKEIPNCGMVVSIDAGSPATVHPPDKLVISRRLSYWALRNDYGWEGLSCASPVFERVEIKGNTAHVFFDNAVNGLTSYGKKLLHFEVAGDDKIFHEAEAEITREGIAVQSVKVAKPIAVRYAFKDFVAGNLYNTEGLPAAPFRTDNWH